MSRFTRPALAVAAAVALVLGLGAGSSGAVVGGVPLTAADLQPGGRYEWLVATIDVEDQSLCTGMVVAPRWVLTAGHCVGADGIVLGSNDLGRGRVALVDAAVAHPAVGAGMRPHDVALLRLSTPLEVAPAPLTGAEGDGLRPDVLGIVAGWGFTPELSSLAHEGVVRVAAADASLVLSVPGPSEPCRGDSGGPLLVDGVVVGVIGFGDAQCARYAGFTRLTAVHAWLTATIAPPGSPTAEPVLDPVPAPGEAAPGETA
jgi:trypsin